MQVDPPLAANIYQSGDSSKIPADLCTSALVDATAAPGAGADAPPPCSDEHTSCPAAAIATCALEAEDVRPRLPASTTTSIVYACKHRSAHARLLAAETDVAAAIRLLEKEGVTATVGNHPGSPLHCTVVPGPSARLARLPPPPPTHTHTHHTPTTTTTTTHMGSTPHTLTTRTPPPPPLPATSCTATTPLPPAACLSSRSVP